MPNFMDHTPNLGAILSLDRLVQASESQRTDRALLVGLLPDDRANVGDLQRRHRQLTGSPSGAVDPSGSTAGAAAAAGLGPRRLSRSSSSAGLPRASATASAVFSACNAAIVARTVFTGLFVPSDFVIMSFTPESSTTARIAPPERIPVPGAAGFSRTFAAPFFIRPTCGIVAPPMGTVPGCFLAASTAFLIASVTSPALPRPAPTR